MAQLTEAPKFDEVETGGGLPPGEYIAIVTYSEIRETKKKQSGEAERGELLAMTFQVIEGEFMHQKIFANFNLKNDNEIAEKIGWSDLKKICKALDMTDYPANTIEYHDKPLMIVVGPNKQGDRTEIKNFKKKPTYQAPQSVVAKKQSAPPAAWG